LAARRGIELEVKRATQTSGTVLKSDGALDLNFVHGGSVHGIGWLNSSIAYLQGFWHVNKDGVLANSSARNQTFEPSRVRRHAADAFAEQLRVRFAEKRLSRYKQPKTRAVLPREYIAVFLQGRYPYANNQSYFSMEGMLKEVVVGAGPLAVVVKPHPLEKALGLDAIARVQSAGYNVLATDANVHDMIESSIAVVSVNSSVSFEAFIHRKPALVFGRTDHSSLVETVEKAGDFPLKFSSALQRDWDYAGMLHWYFKNHTLRIDSRNFPSHLALAIESSGRDPSDFGIADT
jgi:Capsule polysaccharide biosynthesis protein